MKAIYSTLLSTAAVLAAVPTQAATVVADFNGIPMTDTAATDLGPNGWTVLLTPCCVYEEDGFRFDTDWGGAYGKWPVGIGAVTSSNPSWWTGSQGLFHSYGGSAQYTNSFVVTRVGGGVFDLLSLDVAAFSNASRYFMVYGHQADGDWVQQYFPLLDNSYNTLETLSFGADFRNLTEVSFTAYGQQIDNVTFGIASSVPEPETYALMLGGLALLGWQTKHRNKRRQVASPAAGGPGSGDDALAPTR